MTKITKKYASLVAATVLVFGSFTPAVFAADTTVSGNGSSSTNTVTKSVTNTDTTVQNNSASVTNSISSSASTGGNTANDNTGGDTFVSTGNARSTVDVSNMLNGNVITKPAGMAMPSGTTLIEGNGSYSTNNVTGSMVHDSSAFQTNTANVDNSISSSAETGYNDANRNTGGATQVSTGNATSEVGVTNRTNLNQVLSGMGVGAAATTTTGGDVNAIMGNGSHSSNAIADYMTHDSSIVQDNSSSIANSVDNYANTGYNRLKDNTGGSVIANTGAAYAGTLLDTMGNVNIANDGSWMTDGSGMTLLDRNGSYSDNSVLSDMTHANTLFQNADTRGPSFSVSNAVTNDPSTGDNALKRNTLGSGDATAAVTGNSRSETVVTTAGNANVAGSLGSITLPGGTSLDLNFDLGSLLSGLRMF